MLLTISAERACTGSRSTRAFHWLFAGNTGHGPTLGPAAPPAPAPGRGEPQRGQQDQRSQECTAPHRLEGRPGPGPMGLARRMF